MGYPEHGKFRTTGEYNEIHLSWHLVRRVFVQFMEPHESYHQASFQMRYDEGNTADHTHKYAKVIKASGRKGHVFSASYTVASLTWFINVSRLVFTKTMFELEKLMMGYKDARENVNAPPLRHFESDNLNGDGGLWMKHFKKDLMEIVTPPLVCVMDGNLPYAKIADDSYAYITNSAQANISVRSAYQNVDSDENNKDEPFYIGLDTENNYILDGSVDSSLTHVLQICLPNKKVAVLHLSSMRAICGKLFPRRVREFLEHPNIVTCDIQIGGDLSRLKQLGVNTKRCIETR
jgi:hypothetical protein